MEVANWWFSSLAIDDHMVRTTLSVYVIHTNDRCGSSYSLWLESEEWIFKQNTHLFSSVPTDEIHIQISFCQDSSRLISQLIVTTWWIETICEMAHGVLFSLCVINLPFALVSPSQIDENCHNEQGSATFSGNTWSISISTIIDKYVPEELIRAHFLFCCQNWRLRNQWNFMLL